jgi:hypothetical protein
MFARLRLVGLQAGDLLDRETPRVRLAAVIKYQKQELVTRDVVTDRLVRPEHAPARDARPLLQNDPVEGTLQPVNFPLPAPIPC